LPGCGIDECHAQANARVDWRAVAKGRGEAHRGRGVEGGLRERRGPVDEACVADRAAPIDDDFEKDGGVAVRFRRVGCREWRERLRRNHLRRIGRRGDLTPRRHEGQRDRKRGPPCDAGNTLCPRHFLAIHGGTGGRKVAVIRAAERLGKPLVEFPGAHAGFASEPEAFAAVLRQTLG